MVNYFITAKLIIKCFSVLSVLFYKCSHTLNQATDNKQCDKTVLCSDFFFLFSFICQ